MLIGAMVTSKNRCNIEIIIPELVSNTTLLALLTSCPAEENRNNHMRPP